MHATKKHETKTDDTKMQEKGNQKSRIRYVKPPGSSGT